MVFNSAKQNSLLKDFVVMKFLRDIYDEVEQTNICTDI